MRPLDIKKLPEPLLTQYRDMPAVREWLHLMDRVRRAEKISSWAQWTPEEAIAYEVEDYRQFSQLRGYSESEIGEFLRFVQLSFELDCEMALLGESDFCAHAEWAVLKASGKAAFVLRAAHPRV